MIFIKLILCKLGLHKWQYYQRKIHHNDNDYFRDTTHTIEQRKCIICERLEESVYGYTWRNIERRKLK